MLLDVQPPTQPALIFIDICRKQTTCEGAAWYLPFASRLQAAPGTATLLGGQAVVYVAFCQKTQERKSFTTGLL